MKLATSLLTAARNLRMIINDEAERGPADPGGVIKKLINQEGGRFHIYESTQRRMNSSI